MLATYPDDAVGSIAEFLDYRSLCLVMRSCVSLHDVVSNLRCWLWGRLYCSSFPEKRLRNYRDMQLQYKKRVATSMRELMRRVGNANLSADIDHKCNLVKQYNLRIATMRNAKHILHPSKSKSNTNANSIHLSVELIRAQDRLRRVELQLVDLREAKRIHELVGEYDPWYFKCGRKRKRAESIPPLRTALLKTDVPVAEM
jgi:hypothetical protein